MVLYKIVLLTSILLKFLTSLKFENGTAYANSKKVFAIGVVVIALGIETYTVELAASIFKIF